MTLSSNANQTRHLRCAFSVCMMDSFQIIIFQTLFYSTNRSVVVHEYRFLRLAAIIHFSWELLPNTFAVHLKMDSFQISFVILRSDTANVDCRHVHDGKIVLHFVRTTAEHI